MDAISPGNESDAESMYSEMLEDIIDVSKYHRSVNRWDAYYKICDRIKRGQLEWTGALLFTRNMG